MNITPFTIVFAYIIALNVTVLCGFWVFYKEHINMLDRLNKIKEDAESQKAKDQQRLADLDAKIENISASFESLGLKLDEAVNNLTSMVEKIAEILETILGGQENKQKKSKK